MGWKTIIVGTECQISLSEKRMKITIEDEYQTVPLCDIDTVIFSHDRTVITIPLLSELVNNNINVIICNSKNDPIGVFLGFNTHSLAFKQLDNQINWKVTRKKKLWKMIIESKIQSEIDVLRINDTCKNTQATLQVYKNSVYNDDQTNREAAAARIYFESMFGESFTRDDPSAINFALNYGYKIIASYISKCIASRGLITQLGIHHIGEGNSFNLTYDFIESFRAIVDLWTYLNVVDKFGVIQKTDMINILNCKVCINHKWYRLNNAIESIVDSYISFLNENSNTVLQIDYAKGINFDVDG